MVAFTELALFLKVCVSVCVYVCVGGGHRGRERERERELTKWSLEEKLYNLVLSLFYVYLGNQNQVKKLSSEDSYP